MRKYKYFIISLIAIIVFLGVRLKQVESQLQSMKTIFNNVWDKANSRLMITPWAGAQQALESETAILNNVWDKANNRLRTSDSGGGGGSGAFSDLTTGTNTTATMTVGTGAAINTSGSGTIAATTAANITDGDKGDVSISSGSWSVDNNTITYSKLQDISAASRLLCRGSAAGAGDPQECTLGTGLSLSGTTLNATTGGNVSNTGTPLDNQVAVFTSDTVIEGDPALTYDKANALLGLGVSGGIRGKLNLFGETSGVITLMPGSGAAGTWDMRLPSTAGNAGEFLTSQGAGQQMTWSAGGGGGVTTDTTQRVAFYNSTTSVDGAPGLTVASDGTTVDTIAPRISTISTNTTLTSAHGPIINCDTSGGNVIITLMDGTSSAQRWFYITKTSAANTCSVDANGTETLNGSTNSIDMLQNKETLDIHLTDTGATANWSAISGVTDIATQAELDAHITATGVIYAAMTCDGSAADAAALQTAVNAAITSNRGRTVVIPWGSTGQCAIGTGITIANVEALRIKGDSTLLWTGNNTSPMFLCQDCRDVVFEGFRINASATTPLLNAFQFENGSGSTVTPTSNVIRDVRIECTNAGCTNGIRLAQGAGGDANNDFLLVEHVTINNADNACVRIEHSQSKHNRFKDFTCHNNGNAPYGIETTAGSFICEDCWMNQNTTADFFVATTTDPIIIRGGSSENSARLYEGAGPGSSAMPVTIENFRWACESLNVDNKAIIYKQGGPLRLVGNTFEPHTECGALEIYFEPLNGIGGFTAISNYIASTRTNPFTGTVQPSVSFGNTTNRGSGLAELPNSMR